MELRPLRSKRDHAAALKQAEALWDAREGTPEADRLAVLVMLIENYEREHFPIPDPDPIQFLEHVIEARGIARKDLEPYIGSRARVAEVMNRVRPLTLEMIRRLSSGLKLPAEVLVRDYRLRKAA
ncbi:MAG: DNA-binding protein [Betaproteobacteria bacterium RIFCSPLOWO2_02_FULL_66_14]|nr:MAG: DNA-binding protein [Betaproteobacteria bacterium RIFCSPLOWO2_02_FULL_66_14]